jgi:hypothetical protein
MRADNVAFLVIDKGEDLIEERLALEAEEFCMAESLIFQGMRVADFASLSGLELA